MAMKPTMNCRHCNTSLAGEQYAAVLRERCTSCFRSSYPNPHGNWCPGCGGVLNAWHPDDGMCEHCHELGITSMIRPTADQVRNGWWQTGCNGTWRPGKNSGSSKSSGGGCYITSATLKACASSDDQHPTLVALRGFRDTYMRSTERGARLVDLYYDTAPSIVEAIDASIGSTETYLRIHRQYIAPCIRLIEEHRPAAAQRHYTRMVTDLARQHLRHRPQLLTRVLTHTNPHHP